MTVGPGAGIVRRIETALGGRPVTSVRLLGRGTDHVAYDVDGALVARFATHEGAAGIEHETRVLDLAASVSPVPVPTVVAADPAAGVLVLRKLPGTSLLAGGVSDPGAIADQLAGFMSCLYAVPPDRLAGIAVDTWPLMSYRAEAADNLSAIAAVITPAHRRLVARFLGAPLPPAPHRLLFCHNDLGAEHVLAAADRTTLTGVIDWSDAAVADPAHDLGRVYRDLGPAVAARILDRLPLDDRDGIWRRSAFHARCALLEDLVHGVTTGNPQYTAAALASLSRTFATVM